MGDKIPVTFEFEGKTYHGYFEQPLGSSSNSWQLTVPEDRKGRVGNYRWGQLVKFSGDIWRFHNHKDDMLHLSDYFRDVVLNWYQ